MGQYILRYTNLLTVPGIRISVPAPIYMRGDKRDCSDYQNIYHSYHPPTSLTNLPSRLIPYAIGYFRITDTDKLFCIYQILEKQWQYEAVYQMFRAFKKAHDSVRQYALYKILNGATYTN